MLSSARLYCILDLGYVTEQNAESVTQSLLNGGADLLQLRAKNHDLATIRRVAEKLLPLCRAAGVPFILNDHLALAAEIGADGVHLGQDDGIHPAQDRESRACDSRQLASRRSPARLADRQIHSGLHSFIHPSPPGPPDSSRPSTCPGIADRRRRIHSSSPIPNPQSPISNPSPPRPFLIGRSTHSLAQARAALAEGFDYIGFGPLFPTPTKAGRPAIGLHEIAAMEREVGAIIPAFCIGGITPETLPAVLAAGARRVVIVSALLQAPDIQAATRAVREMM